MEALDQFRASDPKIRRQADDYLLESSDFCHLATAEEVFDHATELLRRVNGAMRLLRLIVLALFFFCSRRYTGLGADSATRRLRDLLASRIGTVLAAQPTPAGLGHFADGPTPVGAADSRLSRGGARAARSRRRAWPKR
jgi:hypothetical protein